MKVGCAAPNCILHQGELILFSPPPPLAEFRGMWHALETPPAHTLPLELQEAGLTSSTSANVKPPPTQKKSKKKGRGGKVKITNTHLKDLGIDLSKDYVPANAGQKK